MYSVLIFAAEAASVPYSFSARITAIKNVMIPARIASTPIMAGQPWTEPLNVTDHWLIG